jgi:hypothetical protein
MPYSQRPVDHQQVAFRRYAVLGHSGPDRDRCSHFDLAKAALESLGERHRQRSG